MSDAVKDGRSDEVIGKAGGFLSMTAVARDRLGGEGFAAAPPPLSPETRAYVQKPPLPMSWMPSRPFMEVLDAVAAAAGRADQEGFEIGREQMRRDMSTVYKVLMHL